MKLLKTLKQFKPRKVKGSVMNIQKELQAFRTVAISKGWDMDGETTSSNFNFYSLQTRSAWESWQAAKDQMVPEWISVEDEFPKKNLKVLLNLVTRKNGKPIKCIGFYSIEPDEEPCFVLDDNFTELKGVTHWVRLPDSPKAQEQSHD